VQARRTACSLIALPVVVLVACSAQRPTEVPKPQAPILLVAVLEIEPLALGGPGAEGGAVPRLTPDAGRAVTGQIYGALADRSDFRFVPDLTVLDAVRDPTVKNAPTLLDKARALTKVVTTDGVLFGTVSRFEERVGTEFGATHPAAVTFDLSLLESASGEVVWHGEFAQRQEALTTNLLQFWMFWHSGPRWLTARELARLGVDRLLDDMRRTARP